MIFECSACENRYEAYLKNTVTLANGHVGWRTECDCCGKKWFLDKEKLHQKKPLSLQRAMSALNELSSKQRTGRIKKYSMIFATLIALVFVSSKYNSFATKKDVLTVNQLKSEIKETKDGTQITVFGEVLNPNKTAVRMRPIEINVIGPNTHGKNFMASWKHQLTKQEILPKERISFQTNQVIKEGKISKIEVSIN